MIVAGIIAEFNPFHNGHKLLIDRARREFGADYVVVLMSGDFTQNGMPAIAGRHLRAEMALYGGADVVISYPTRYATASAEGFAENAVRILQSLGVVDFLIFGSENGDITALTRAAAILVSEPEAYSDKLRELLKSGMSFPRARETALAGIDPDAAALLREPNNILAIEYIKALMRLGSGIRPVTVRREGAAYHDVVREEGSAAMAGGSSPILSATAIREGFLKENITLETLKAAMPPEALGILLNDQAENGYMPIDDFSILLADRIFSAHTPSELMRCDDVTTELANAIFAAKYSFRSYSLFAHELKSKHITHSHIYRALLHIALGIEHKKYKDIAHVLGFSAEGQALIGVIRLRARCRVILNPGSEMRALSPSEREFLEEETRISNLYNLHRSIRSGKPMENTLSRFMVKTPPRQ